MEADPARRTTAARSLDTRGCCVFFFLAVRSQGSGTLPFVTGPIFVKKKLKKNTKNKKTSVQRYGGTLSPKSLGRHVPTSLSCQSKRAHYSLGRLFKSSGRFKAIMLRDGDEVAVMLKSWSTRCLSRFLLSACSSLRFFFLILLASHAILF